MLVALLLGVTTLLCVHSNPFATPCSDIQRLKQRILYSILCTNIGIRNVKMKNYFIFGLPNNYSFFCLLVWILYVYNDVLYVEDEWKIVYVDDDDDDDRINKTRYLKKYIFLC